MKNQLQVRIFSIFVILSMLLSALSIPIQVAQAATTVTVDGGFTPTLDSAPITGTANNTNIITLSYTTGSGNNRLLLVGVSFSATTAMTVSSVTFGGTALTSVGTSNNGTTRRVAIYRLTAPAASTTADVVVNFSGAVYAVASAVSFAGVNQCNPLGAFLGATGNSCHCKRVPGHRCRRSGIRHSFRWFNFDGQRQPDSAMEYFGWNDHLWRSQHQDSRDHPDPHELDAGHQRRLGYRRGGHQISLIDTATGTAATLSFCHWTGTGTNRLMLVGVSWNANTTVTPLISITFTPTGGSPIPLSLVITQQSSWLLRSSAIYSLVNPPIGQSGTVLVTFSGAVGNGVVAGATNFAGVDMTTPLGPAKGGDGVERCHKCDLDRA